MVCLSKSGGCGVDAAPQFFRALGHSLLSERETIQKYVSAQCVSDFVG